MTPELIGLIVTGIGGLFLFFGLFWGLIRGLKKSLFRGLWLFALALIMFFVTPSISRALCNMDISFLNIKVGDVTATSVFGAIKEAILSVQDIADIADKNPSLIPMIEQLIILVINLIVFPISYWLAKIVTYPIWAIISAIIFKKKKTVVNGKKMRVKVKKHRLSGMLLGAVASVMVLVVTLMPISGTINLVQKIDDLEYTSVEEDNEGKGLITSVAGEEVMQYVDAYSDSVLSKAFKYTGISFISNSMYDFLSTAKVDGQKVSLSQELQLYVSLYNDINNITKTDFDNLTQQSMSIFLNSSEGLVKKLFSSAVLNVVGDDLIPYAVELLEENESFKEEIEEIDTEILKQLLLDSLQEFKTTEVNSLQQDVLNAIYIAKALNDGNILVPAINGDLKSEDYLDLFTDTVVDQVTKYMFKMPSLNKIYPLALDSAFVYLSEELGFEYTSQDYTQNGLNQEDFANVIKGGLAVARTVDTDSQFYVTKASFEAIGSFLDVLKNLNVLQNGMFDNIVDKLFEKGKEEINKSEQSETVKELLGTLIDEVEELIVNREVLLQTEFKEYGIVFDDIKTTVDEFNASDKKHLNLATYGKLLDRLNETAILMEVLPDAIDVAWEQVEGDFNESMSEFPNIGTIIGQIKDNIVLVLENQHIPEADREVTSTGGNMSLSMETELQHLQSFYDFILDNISSYFDDEGTGADGLQDELFKEDSTLISSLGRELDALNTNLIITPKVVKNLMVEIFDTLKDGLSNDERSQEFVNDIVENMRNSTIDVVWESELGYIKQLANFAKDGFDINTVGEVLDDVYRSTFIGNALINELIQEEIQKEYDNMDASKKNLTTDAIIAKIKTNISTIQEGIYEREIGHMLDMLDMIEQSATMSYTELGTALDAFNSSRTIASVRTDMIDYALDDRLLNETEGSIFYKVLTTIKANLAEVPTYVNADFYTKQFNGINSITPTAGELEYPETKDDLTFELLQDIGGRFFEISDRTTHVLVYNLGELVIGEMLSQVDYEDLNDVVYSLKTHVATGPNALLTLNRKVTASDAFTISQQKARYVACFTDIYELINIYESVDALETDENADGAVIGGYLDQVEALSIITNDEDEMLAYIILDNFETSIKDTISGEANARKTEINSVPDEVVDPATKQSYCDEVDGYKDTYTGQFMTVLQSAEDSVASKDNVNNNIANPEDKVTYADIFGTLLTNIKDIVDDARNAITQVGK